MVKKLISAACILSFFCAPVLFGQTEEEAAAAYNKGAGMVQTDVQGAISAFEQAIELATKAGEAAKPIADNAKAAIPGLYKQIADKLLQEKKLDEALKAYETAAAQAGKYGNEAVAQASKDAVPQINFALAGQALAARDYASAVVLLDKVVAADATNLDALFLKGEALRAGGQGSEAVAIYEQVIAKSTAANLAEITEKAKKSAANVILAEASALMKEKKNAEALTSLEKAIGFDDANAGALQTLVQLYAAGKQNDKVIETATRFLEVKGGDPKASSTIYYFLGVAYQAKNNAAKACEAYKVAVSDKNPQIQAFVKGQMEQVLKCK